MGVVSKLDSSISRRAFAAATAGTLLSASVAARVAGASEGASRDKASEGADASGENGSSARAAAEADETRQFDVVVVGAGAAGLVAADHLCDQGLNVCLLEKGGSITMSNYSLCGGPNACETRLQQQEGAWVSLDDMYEYMYGFSNGSVNARLLKNVLAGTGPAIDRMMDLGIPMHLWGDPYGTGFRGRHYFDDDGTQRTQLIADDISTKGGTIVTSADVYAILEEDGVVSGVQAEVKGKTVNFKAKATVVCTGGFLGNAQMQEQHFNTPVFALGNSVSDGTGIQMVLDVGGVLDRQFAILGNECGAVSPATTGWPFTEDWANKNEHYGWWLFGGLYVDATGSRFCDEGRVAQLPLAYGGEVLARAGRAWVVMDDDYYQGVKERGIWEFLGKPETWTAGEENGFYSPTPENADAHLQQAIDEGWGTKADTIEEIAEKFGLAGLPDTVEAYNGYCDAGSDGEFYKDPAFLTPVRKPPFYAFEYVPSAWGTNGGIKTDSRLRAVDRDNRAIPGLYVAGVDCGSMYTQPYYTNPGSSVGNAIGSGWFVAESVAQGLAE